MVESAENENDDSSIADALGQEGVQAAISLYNRFSATSRRRLARPHCRPHPRSLEGAAAQLPVQHVHAGHPADHQENESAVVAEGRGGSCEHRAVEEPLTLERDFGNVVLGRMRTVVLVRTALRELHQVVLQHMDRLKEYRAVREKVLALSDAKKHLHDPQSMEVGQFRFDGEWHEPGEVERVAVGRGLCVRGKRTPSRRLRHAAPAQG